MISVGNLTYAGVSVLVVLADESTRLGDGIKDTTKYFLEKANIPTMNGSFVERYAINIIFIGMSSFSWS